MCVCAHIVNCNRITVNFCEVVYNFIVMHGTLDPDPSFIFLLCDR